MNKTEYIDILEEYNCIKDKVENTNAFEIYSRGKKSTSNSKTIPSTPNKPTKEINYSGNKKPSSVYIINDEHEKYTVD